MRKIHLGVFIFLLGHSALSGATVAQWNFNSPYPDDEAATGSTSPSVGTGSAVLVGAVNATFVTGDVRHDPAGSEDNSAWRTSKYPGVDAANKTDGFRFDVDTTGYDHIGLSWNQQNSATASRYFRVQYSVDGVSFRDADVIGIFVEGVFTNQTVDFGGIAGVANNPLFAFRLVSEWESTAAGSGSPAYVATKATSPYGPGGATRLDMVTVMGDMVPGANSPPTLSFVEDRTLRVNQTSNPILVRLDDAEDPGESLTLSAHSSDSDILPDSNLVLSGSGNVRTLTVLAGNRAGTVEVSLVVTDSGGRSTSERFLVSILEANTAPWITPIARTNTFVNLATEPLGFEIGDSETTAGELSLAGSSFNPGLVPSEGILFGGTGGNRTVVAVPSPGRTGVAPLSITVSDGTNSACTLFPLMVTASPNVVLCEPFDYPDGSLGTNSAFLWSTRSGKAGECEVRDGRLKLCSTQSEDVVASLLGCPFFRTSNVALYASFSLQCLSLPRVQPGLLAHFGDGSTLRGRLYLGCTNATPGHFRVFVSNGSGPPVELANDLMTNHIYRLVLRYEVSGAATTLWLDASTETDPSTEASDPQTPAPIVYFGFRQDNDLGGTFLIDDLLVGLSFSSVSLDNPGPPANTLPTISPICSTNTLVDTSTPALNFTVKDRETDSRQLRVYATSLNPDLVGADSFIFSGTEELRSVCVRPLPGMTGIAPIRVMVSDGTNETCSTFAVMVTASEQTLFTDHFDYLPSSSIMTASSFWQLPTSVVAHAFISEGKLQLPAPQRACFLAKLVGGPFPKEDVRPIYASFRFSFESLPGAAAGLIAYFSDGLVPRGGIFVSTSNALPGFFRLQLVGGSSSSIEWPGDLQVNAVYTVVTRYRIYDGLTTLWLDPTDESALCISATDSLPAINISAYGFSQDSDVSAGFWVDEVNVGRRFSDVSAASDGSFIPLRIQVDGDAVWLCWTNSDFGLQSAVHLEGPYEDVPMSLSPYRSPLEGESRFFRLKAR